MVGTPTAFMEIDTCRATKNSHFQWFARLIENHYEGIMAHASLQIASGKIEGINNKIKVMTGWKSPLPEVFITA